MRALAARVALCAVLLVLAGCVTGPQNRKVAADYYDIGNAYADLGQYDKAIQYYQTALQVDPSFAKANYNLALAYARMKRTDDAVGVLKQLLLADPKNTQILSTLGWAYHLGGKETEALAQYDAVLGLSPADQDALYNSGIILWKLDRKSEALGRIQKALAISPEDADALYAAGSLYLALDQPADATGMLNRYLDKKPSDIDALFLAAVAAERLQKYSRELDAFDKIIAIDAKQGDAWFGECRLLLTVVEDPSRGLDALSKALEAGFHDQAAIKALLASTELLDRDKVEGLLKDHNQFPPPDAASPGTPVGTAPAGAAAPAPPPGSAPARGSPAAPRSK
jgi:tetratricopeptide (TPR) repeat protein